MEDNLTINVDQIVFELYYNRGHYADAINRIKQLFQRLQMKRLDIEDSIRRICSNAVQISPSEYRKIHDDTFDLMNECRTEFENYRRKTKASIEELDLSANTKEIHSKYCDLLQIDSLLSQTITIIGDILNRLMEFSNTYAKESSSQMLNVLSRKRSFRRDIFDRIMKSPVRFDAFQDFILPLFSRNPTPVFNLQNAFNFSPRSYKEKDDFESAIIPEIDDDSEEVQLLKNREKAIFFNTTVTLMMKRLLDSPDHTLRFSEMCADMPDDFDYYSFASIYGRFIEKSSYDLLEETDPKSIYKDYCFSDFKRSDALCHVSEIHPQLNDFRWLIQNRCEDVCCTRFFKKDGDVQKCTFTEHVFSLKYADYEGSDPL